MNVLTKTPFKLSKQELLTAVAASLLIKRLAEVKTPLGRISDLCETPKYGYTEKATKEPVGPKFVRITDIKANSIDWQNVPYCQCKDISSYQLLMGDILVGRTGSVGKTIIVKHVPEPAVYASYLIRIRPHHDLNCRYVYWCLQTNSFWEQILRLTRGSAIKNINGKMLSDLTFPVPKRDIQDAVANFLDGFSEFLDETKNDIPPLPAPLTEQRRIVEKIERLAGKIEEAKELRKQCIKDAEVLIQATVSKIDGIMRETHALTKLENFATRERGSFRSGPFGSALLHEEFVADGVPAIGIQDVKENRFELSRKWNVTPKKAEELKRYTIKPHDILVTVMGTLGRACVVPDEVPQMISTKHVWTITLNQARAEPLWVSFWINYSQLVRKELLGQGTGTAIPGLNGEKLRSLSLPEVSLPDQRRIVARLNDLQTEINVIKRLQAQTTAELDAMLPSILDKAFKGEL